MIEKYLLKKIKMRMTINNIQLLLRTSQKKKNKRRMRILGALYFLSFLAGKLKILNRGLASKK